MKNFFKFQPKKTAGGKIENYVHQIPDDFNSAEYLLLNVDLIESGIDPELHYVRFGRIEGRIYKAGEIKIGYRNFDLNLMTILLVTHDLSFTGSPMLALDLLKHLSKKVNLVVMSYTAQGPLLDQFLQHSVGMFLFNTNPRNSEIIELTLKQIDATFNIDCAIANSSATHLSLLALERNDIPSVSLIHEFGTFETSNSIKEAIKASKIALFTSKSILDDAINKNSLPANKKFGIVKQGIINHSELTLSPNMIEIERERIDKRFSSEFFHVVGIGSIILTKGIDLFINTITVLEKKYPDRFKFTWVAPISELTASEYAFFISDSTTRTKLLKNFEIFNTTSEIEYLLSKIQCFALTSRLDTMPNVAIEAMAAAKPVISFENTGGISEILIESGFKELCIADYLNTTSFAEKIENFFINDQLCTRVGSDLRRVALEQFNSQKFADEILDYCKVLTFSDNDYQTE